MTEHNHTAFSALRKHLPKIVFFLCVIQPLLDVAGFWQNRLGVGNTVTMAIRMLLLAGTFLLGFLLTDRRRWYFLTAAVLAALTLGHTLACMQGPNGYVQPVSDLINLVRIFFLPLMTLCFITFLRQNEKVFSAMQKGMLADVVIIAMVQLLSELTGTDPHTYSVDGIGILGWFMWTNSQSAILAMLSPIIILWTVRRSGKKLLPAVLITAISEATLYVLAPRLAYGSLVGIGIGVFVCILLRARSEHWKQGLAVLLITLLFVAAYPLSATYKRLNANAVRVEEAEKTIEREHIVIPRENTQETDENNKSGSHKPVIILEDKTAQKLEKLYRSQDIIWSMVERFGRDRVFQIYNYTLDPEVLSNARQMKINFCTLTMEDAGPLSHLFGLNLVDLTAQRYDAKGVLVTDNYDVENDYHGVYFLTGWCGLVCMILFLLYFGVRALIAVIHDPKRFFSLPMCGFAMAYGLGLIHAYYTASVLRRNNASIFLAMVLAGLWYLSSKSEGQQHAD